MSSNYYAVIMAGGVGSRFWPVSTPEFPKQFHDMLGSGETLIQKTFKRLSQLIPKENILILTHQNYQSIVEEQLPSVERENIILEPAMRNTAPCILYAAMKIKKMNHDAVMVVAPSDHWIEDELQFISNLQRTFDVCERDKVLMTLGILPTFPNTGYGYIEFNKLDSRPIKKVVQFREKPDYVTARKFIQSRHFLWNSGIFVWSVGAILDAFSEFQPAMTELFDQGYDAFNTANERVFIEANYDKAENISIDYAVMEKANNVYVLPATFISIIMAGKMGSFITSSIGTMRVTEQIDALEVMGVSSVNYLVFPKLVAVLLYPFVIGISMFLGILGGWFGGVMGNFVTSEQFIVGLQEDFIPFHILYAFIKTTIFGFLLATIPAYFGYYMKGGALEVGKASTTAFVWTSVAIILTNYILTSLLLSN